MSADDGVRLFYQKVGSGPVVIVPGRLFVFASLSTALTGRTIISYDMRNRGRSDAVADPARISIQHDVRDLEAVRKHFNVERFSTVGYSYLGLMVVMYAVDHPDRIERIVQIGPVPRRLGTEYPNDQVARDGVSVLDAEAVAELRRHACGSSGHATKRVRLPSDSHLSDSTRHALSRPRDQSCRSAVTGSSRAARRAGP